MQAGDSEPIVRIRDLQKNSVDFVLENVDLAYVIIPDLVAMVSYVLSDVSLANSVRRVVIADIPTVGKYSMCDF